MAGGEAAHRAVFQCDEVAPERHFIFVQQMPCLAASSAGR